MPEVHMMSGIAGSGKSHLAVSLVNQLDAVYVSSDEIRERWYGSAAIQGDNSAVFTEIRNQVRSALKKGKPVVYDATNLTRRRRLHFVRNDVRNYPVTAHVLCPPISLCLERNKNRNRSVKEEIILNMYKSFEIPFQEEGYKQIHYYPEIQPNQIDWAQIEQLLRKSESYAELFGALNQLDGFPDIFELPHDTKQHAFSVSRHIFHTLLETRKSYGENDVLKMLWVSALHDIGKGKTKSFIRFNGEKRKYAGYEGHENVGAYLAVRNLYHSGYNREFIYSIAKLIQFHHLDRSVSKKSRKQAGLLLSESEQEELSVFQVCNQRSRY